MWQSTRNSFESSARTSLSMSDWCVVILQSH